MPARQRTIACGVVVGAKAALDALPAINGGDRANDIDDWSSQMVRQSWLVVVAFSRGRHWWSRSCRRDQCGAAGWFLVKGRAGFSANQLVPGDRRFLETQAW
jgi:hypothetical protein